LRGPSLALIQQLREAGLAVDYPLTPAKSDKQFKRALELNALHTVKLERMGEGALQARVKALATRAEQCVPLADVPSRLRRT